LERNRRIRYVLSMVSATKGTILSQSLTVPQLAGPQSEPQTLREARPTDDIVF
jgi:hypothetical protein